MAKGFVLTGQLMLQAPPTANTNKVVADLRQQLKNVDVNIGAKVNPQATARAKQLTNTIKDLGVALDDTNDHFRHFGEQSALAAKRFLAFVVSTTGIIKLMNAIGDGVRNAIAFQNEMVKIAQVTNRTVSGISSLTDEVSRLSIAFGVNSTKLLEAGQILAQAGLSADDTRKSLEALAKTAVSPTFDDLISTTEGAVAIFSQFKISAEELEGQLGSINAVAGKFAVESADIITAVRRTGGAFQAAGGTLNELSALFTSVRATTRESAESIATGFRTIFTRLQRSRTIEFLDKLGIKLRDVNNQFIGPYQAIERLSDALNGIQTTDPRFSQIIEELGGFRQISKVIPLIQEFGEAQKALTVAQLGQKSLALDAARAQESFAIQLQKVTERFDAFIRKLTSTSAFKTTISVLVKVADAALAAAEAFEPLAGVIGLLATLKLGSASFSFFPGFKEKVLEAPRKKKAGGIIQGFNSGGLVPGSGNSDTVPAMLTPGEFVMRKKAVRDIGVRRLAKLNRHSTGGREEGINPFELMSGDQLIRALKNTDFTESKDANVKRQLRLAAQARLSAEDKLYPKWGSSSARFDSLANRLEEKGIGKSIKTASEEAKIAKLPSFGVVVADSNVGSKTASRVDTSAYFTDNESKKHYYKLHIGVLPDRVYDETKTYAREGFKNLIYNSSLNLNKALGAIPNENVKKLNKFIPNYESVFGSIFEGMIASIGAPYDDTESVENNLKRFDFPRGIGATLADKFGDAMLSAIPVEAKKSYTNDARDGIRDKVKSFYETNPEYFALGGMARGTDTVPAMLTPGEFVINKKAAQRIGYGKLNAANRTGRAYFADGGKVSLDGMSFDETKNLKLFEIDAESLQKLFKNTIAKFENLFKVTLPAGMDIAAVRFKKATQQGGYIGYEVGNTDNSAVISGDKIRLSELMSVEQAITTLAHELTHHIDNAVGILEGVKTGKPIVEEPYSLKFKDNADFQSEMARERAAIVKKGIISSKYLDYRTKPNEIVANLAQSTFNEEYGFEHNLLKMGTGGPGANFPTSTYSDAAKSALAEIIDKYRTYASKSGLPTGTQTFYTKGKSLYNIQNDERMLGVKQPSIRKPRTKKQESSDVNKGLIEVQGPMFGPPSTMLPIGSSYRTIQQDIPRLGYTPPNKNTGFVMYGAAGPAGGIEAINLNQYPAAIQPPARMLGLPAPAPKSASSQISANRGFVMYGERGPAGGVEAVNLNQYPPAQPLDPNRILGLPGPERRLGLPAPRPKKPSKPPKPPKPPGLDSFSTIINGRVVRYNNMPNEATFDYGPFLPTEATYTKEAITKGPGFIMRNASRPSSYRFRKDRAASKAKYPLNYARNYGKTGPAPYVDYFGTDDILRERALMADPTNEAARSSFVSTGITPDLKVDLNTRKGLSSKSLRQRSQQLVDINKAFEEREEELIKAIDKSRYDDKRIALLENERLINKAFRDKAKKSVINGNLLAEGYYPPIATGRVPINAPTNTGLIVPPSKGPTVGQLRAARYVNRFANVPPVPDDFAKIFGRRRNPTLPPLTTDIFDTQIPSWAGGGGGGSGLPPLIYGSNPGDYGKRFSNQGFSVAEKSQTVRDRLSDKLLDTREKSTLAHRLGKTLGFLKGEDTTYSQRAERRGDNIQKIAILGAVISNIAQQFDNTSESMQKFVKVITQATASFSVFKSLSNSLLNVRYNSDKLAKVEKTLERAQKTKIKFESKAKNYENAENLYKNVADIYKGYSGKAGQDLTNYINTQQSSITSKFEKEIAPILEKREKNKKTGDKLSTEDQAKLAAYRREISVFEKAKLADKRYRKANALLKQNDEDRNIIASNPNNSYNDVIKSRIERRNYVISKLQSSSESINAGLQNKGNAYIANRNKNARKAQRARSNLAIQKKLIDESNAYLRDSDLSNKLSTGTDLLGAGLLTIGSAYQESGLRKIQARGSSGDFVTGSVLQGGGTGLATGAAIGSLAGPIGIAVGAAIGGIGGSVIAYTRALEDAANKVREVEFDVTFKKFNKSINDIAEGNVNLYSNIGQTLSSFRNTYSMYDASSGETRTNLRGDLFNASVPLETTFNKIIKDLAISGLGEEKLTSKFTDIIGKDTLRQLAVVSGRDVSDVEKDYRKKIKDTIEAEKKRKEFTANKSDTDIYIDSLNSISNTSSEFANRLARLKSEMAGVNSELPDFSAMVSEIADVSKVSPNEFSVLLNNARANSGFAGDYGTGVLQNAEQAYLASQRVGSILKTAQAAGGLTGQGLEFNIKDLFKQAGFNEVIVSQIGSVLGDIIGADYRPENISKAILEDFSGTSKKFKDALAQLIEPMNMFTKIGFQIVEFQRGLYEQLKVVDEKILEASNRGLDIRRQTFETVASVNGYSASQRGAGLDAFNRERLSNILGPGLSANTSVGALGSALQATKANIANLEGQKQFGDPRVTAQLNNEYIARDKLIKGLEFLADTANSTAQAQANLDTALNAAKIRQDLVDTRTFGTSEEKFKQNELIGYVRSLSTTGDINSVPEDMRRAVESFLKGLGDSSIADITGGISGNDLVKRARYNSEYQLARSNGLDDNTARQLATIRADENQAADVQTALADFVTAQNNALAANQTLISNFADDRTKFLTQITASFKDFIATLKDIQLRNERSNLEQEKAKISGQLEGLQTKRGTLGAFIQSTKGRFSKGLQEEELNSLLLEGKSLQESIRDYKEGNIVRNTTQYGTKLFDTIDSGTRLSSINPWIAGAVAGPGGVALQQMIDRTALDTQADVFSSKALSATFGNASLNSVNLSAQKISGTKFEELKSNIYSSVLSSFGDSEASRSLGADLVSRFESQFSKGADGSVFSGATSSFRQIINEALVGTVSTRAQRFRTDKEKLAEAQAKYGTNLSGLESVLSSPEYAALTKQFEGGTISFKDLNTQVQELTGKLGIVNQGLNANAAGIQQNQQQMGAGAAAGGGLAPGGAPNAGGMNPAAGGVENGQNLTIQEKVKAWNNWLKGFKLTYGGRGRNFTAGQGWRGAWWDFENGVPTVYREGQRFTFPGFQTGGMVPGFGSGDKVPALLEPGEFVLNRNAVQTIGTSKLSAFNRNVSRFQTGGSVGVSNTVGQSITIDESFSNAIRMFSSSANTLTAALNAFPREITLSANHRVEVIVNGAQVLQNIMPEISNMVVEETKGQINKMLKTKFPQVGPM